MDNIATVSVSLDSIKDIPTTCGVYLFKKNRAYLYIGKSVNLKARIRSHIENAKIDQKEAAIIKNSGHIEYIITDSEFKALLLESKLIQKYLPPYNAIWKDDKSYLYIKITVRDTYPKVFAVRKEDDGKSLYFGPFPSLRSVEALLRKIRKIFPYCSQKKITKRACFYSKINLCSPCPSGIEQQGNKDEKKRLRRMYRRNIRHIVSILKGNSDRVLAHLYRELQEFSSGQRYEEAMKVRDTIYHVEQLIQNSVSAHDQEISYDTSDVALETLYALLKPFFPGMKPLHRIECYDVSNIRQKDATASMVVLEDGRINKSEYRRFRIRNTSLRSDLEMMEEVLKRRLKKSWDAPDLIVVDGGKPQVRQIRAILFREHEEIPIIGIAKNPDRIIIGNESMRTIRQPFHNLGFNLLRRIRDESHRFARKYHLLLRRKRMML